MKVYILFIMTLITMNVNAQKKILLNNTNYLIVKTTDNSIITLSQLANELSKKSVVLFGEEHNDSIAHSIQHQLTQALYDIKKENMALSFEMWERDIQYIMEEYLIDLIREKNFIKESRAWSNYNDYKPILDIAKLNKLDVICANTPARYTNMVTRGTLNALNSLSICVKENFLPPLPIKLAEGRYKEKFEEILGGHDKPGMHMYESQNLWDATMAHSIYAYGRENKKKLILHFNGRFHSDEYLGVTARLQNYYKSGANIATISAFASNEYDESLHKKLGDYVIITFQKNESKTN